jgi:low temperature requirement protein LtrA
MLDEVTREELLEGPVEREQRVTALELFFDLVFVFALTQVTGFLYHDPSWLRLLEALALLMVLWISWSGYLWLGNTAGTDEGAIRVVLFTAMGAVLVVSFAVPNAFGKDALVFGVAFFFVRGLHIVAYVVIAAGDRALRAAVARMARTELPAAAVLVLAGLLPSAPRAACWVPAVLDGQSPSRRASVRL